jgi:DNA modification methylase
MSIACRCGECGHAFDAEPQGGHRVMCGDSTSADDIGKLMNGASADLCFTSPPYGQQRNYKSGGISDWDALMQGVFGILPVKHDAQVLVNLGMIHRDGEWMPYWDGWVEWMRSAGWRRFGWYVWDQGPGLSGDWHGRLAPSHEFIFHFNRVAERARKTKASKMAGKVSAGLMRNADGSMGGGRATKGPSAIQNRKIPDSVVRVMRHKGGIGDAGSHPAVFPVDLVSEMLTAFSDPDDLVFEPFCGSGTQVIAAEQQGRVCCAMELAPAYVDVAVRRWQQFTGGDAIRDGDGATFAEAAPALQEAAE